MKVALPLNKSFRQRNVALVLQEPFGLVQQDHAIGDMKHKICPALTFVTWYVEVVFAAHGVK